MTLIARPYHSQFINDFSGALQELITLLSLVVNAMLLRIIHNSKKSGIGNYQYVIAFFCVSDIFYTVVHWLVYPIPETYTNSFAMKGHGFLHARFWVCFYVAVYLHAFPIVAFHFIYRALAIRKPRLIEEPAGFFAALFSTTLAINLIGLFVTFVLFEPDQEGMVLLRPFFTDNGTSSPVIHSLLSAEEHMQAVYWVGETFSQPRWGNLIGSMILTVIIVAAYVIMVSCCFLINNFLRANAASSKTMTLHRQIFRSLLCQTFYPLVTTYFPLSVCVLFPIYGFSFNWVSIFCPPSCVSHPFFDPLFLIICIPEYRQAFLKNLGIYQCFMRQKAVKNVSTTSKGSIRTAPAAL